MWKQRDPVKRLREQVLASGWAEPDDFERIDEEVRSLIEDAAKFALASPQPEAATALDQVFCG